MKTYKTIQEAFNLGSGDCFFTKGNEFIAVSRKDNDKHDELKKDGFKFMTYDEVLIANNKTHVKTAIFVVIKDTEKEVVKPIREYKRRSYCPDIYEFSDADSGL